ncbi:MAG: hypothetical protein RMY29_004115 [Nostoc sp. CreGUA01]|nr:hypothetical protein [Nostoc sp. CreGUA01]
MGHWALGVWGSRVVGWWGGRVKFSPHLPISPSPHTPHTPHTPSSPSSPMPHPPCPIPIPKRIFLTEVTPQRNAIATILRINNTQRCSRCSSG